MLVKDLPRCGCLDRFAGLVLVDIESALRRERSSDPLDFSLFPACVEPSTRLSHDL